MHTPRMIAVSVCLARVVELSGSAVVLLWTTACGKQLRGLVEVDYIDFGLSYAFFSMLVYVFKAERTQGTTLRHNKIYFAISSFILIFTPEIIHHNATEPNHHI